MPSESRLFLRTSLIALALAFLWGAAMASAEALGVAIPPMWPVEHAHLAFVGWLVNLVIGIAWWMLPLNRDRFPDTAGRYPRWGAAGRLGVAERGSRRAHPRGARPRIAARATGSRRGGRRAARGDSAVRRVRMASRPRARTSGAGRTLTSPPRAAHRSCSGERARRRAAREPSADVSHVGRSGNLVERRTSEERIDATQHAGDVFVGPDRLG